MLKKVVAVAALAALASVLVATTAWGSAKAPARLGAAAAKTIKCGKTVTIGIAYPATGPAASLGAPQFDWANYAKKRWNHSHKLKIKLVVGDTQLGNSPGLAVPVAHSFASNGKMPPRQYRLMHPTARLSATELATLCAWTEHEARRLVQEER